MSNDEVQPNQPFTCVHCGASSARRTGKPFTYNGLVAHLKSCPNRSSPAQDPARNPAGNLPQEAANDTAVVPCFMCTPSPEPSSQPHPPAVSGVCPTPEAKKPWRPTRAQKRDWYGCPEDGCVPSHLATLFYALPWQWTAELTAPPGKLGEYWEEWCETVGSWDRVSDFPGVEPPEVPLFTIRASEPLKLVPRALRADVEQVQKQIAGQPFDSFPFWLATTARANAYVWNPIERRVEYGKTPGPEHVHMIIGGIGWHRVREIFAAWPGVKKGPRPVYRPWNYIHYMTAQEPPLLHRHDASRCQNLTREPIESWNLECVRIGCNYRRRLKRRRENRHRKRRQAAARRAAREAARWSRPPSPTTS